MPIDDPRHLIAGRFDLEQHGRAQQKGGDAAEPEHHGRVEGLDDEESDAEQHQGEAGIVDRQQIQGIEAEQQADRADHAGRDGAGAR